MKRLIVADHNGRIVATGPLPEQIPDMKGKFGFAPLKNQSVHEIELPHHVTTVEHLQELHKTHVVQVEGKSARLVPAKKA